MVVRAARNSAGQRRYALGVCVCSLAEAPGRIDSASFAALKSHAGARAGVSIADHANPGLTLWEANYMKRREFITLIVERVKAILLTPKSEWLVIEREPGDPAYLFANYVAILAAIPVVCGFIRTSINEISLPIFRTVRGVLLASTFASAIVRYLLAFAMVYGMGLIIDALGPTFNGQKNPSNALKLAVYSMTPAWLAGIFLLIPGLSRVFGILGLYGLYLLWVGLPPLMKVPEEKSIGYAAVVVVCAIVISLVTGAIVVRVFLVIGAIVVGRFI
jgi:hypothetical protein